MARDPEQTAEHGRDLLETTRTPGWKLIQEGVADLIESRERDRQMLVDELGTAGAQSVETLTLQIARATGELEGLRALEDITSTMLRRKAEAENNLRNHE